MPEYQRPLPTITPLTKPFYEAAKRHQFVLQRCVECKKFRYPIAAQCPYCASQKYEWAEVSGSGKVSSWIIYEQTFHPYFVKDLPYNVIQVDLEEGPRFYSNLLGVKEEDLRYQMRVKAEFEDVNEEIALIKFRPV